MKIGIAQFRGHVQMCREMVENLTKQMPLTCKVLGANFVLVIDVIFCWIWTQT
jgi:hypothetical protein